MLILRAALSFSQPKDGGRSDSAASFSPQSPSLPPLIAAAPSRSIGDLSPPRGLTAAPARAPGAHLADHGRKAHERAAVAAGPSQPSGYVAPGLRELEADTADLPGGRRRISAENDAFHHRVNPRSMHTRGLAFDQSLRDASRSGAAADYMRQKMRAAGLGDGDFRVIDEYKHPSAHATGGHIHTQFNSQAAAKRYADFSRSGGRAAEMAAARESLKR